MKDLLKSVGQEYLLDSVSTLKGIGPKSSKTLSQASIESVLDLLLLLPRKYKRRDRWFKVDKRLLPRTVTIEVLIKKHIYPKNRRSPLRISAETYGSPLIILLFSFNKAQLKNYYPPGENIVISGDLTLDGSKLTMIHPDYSVKPDEIYKIPEIEPIYPSVYGLGNKFLQKTVGNIINVINDLNPIPEWYPKKFIQAKNWPSFSKALSLIHMPKDNKDLSCIIKARKRLIFDEFYAHHIKLDKFRRTAKKKEGFKVEGDKVLIKNLINNLSFQLTKGQLNALYEILDDIESEPKMNRLLQGDVGSGKTIVVLLAAMFVVSGGHQVAIMAPTEVLAMQHAKSLKDVLRAQEINKLNVTILTGSDNRSEREKKLLLISCGEAKIVIGTHALFQRNVHFHNLRLAVIDEQHKFGVMQRFRLEKKGNVNSIIMSATPIPRSLALTVFSDRDLTTIKEKPKNRLSIETLAISVKKIRKLLDKLAKQMSEGQQVYWVCPLIEENENNHLSNSNDRFLYLRNEFSQFKVGLIHGQMPSEDKESELKKFNERKIDILVSTTVIEVGIDNPNATAIVIENANRFGLSQLHQLRGRVGRGDKKSYCFLVYDGNLSDQAIQRLKIMKETQDGFEIAEKDMALRGSGDLLGTMQSGHKIFKLSEVTEEPELFLEAYKLAQDTKTAVPKRY
jgi:ATP-dependent DNA helicase RecG